MTMPKIWYGTYKIPNDSVTDCCLQALDYGYRHIDTAQRYENESGVWKALKQTTVSRKDIFVTTKIWMTNFSYQQAYDSTIESLRKLQTDYVDLLLIHRPNTRADHRPVLDAMMDLHREQKICHIWVSNYPIGLLQEAIEYTNSHIYTNQVEYHIHLWQKKLRAFCREHDIIMTAYFPLGHGRLLDDKTLLAIGKKYKKTPAQIALRRLVEQEGITTIVKSMSPSRMQENIDIFDFALDDQDKELIAQLPKNNRYCNPEFHPVRDD